MNSERITVFGFDFSDLFKSIFNTKYPMAYYTNESVVIKAQKRHLLQRFYYSFSPCFSSKEEIQIEILIKFIQLSADCDFIDDVKHNY